MLSYLWVRDPSAEGPDRRSRAGSPPRFGWRLYHHFFKTYNEKLWGVPVNKLPADFAAQRIKNLSLINAVIDRADAASATRRTSRR